MGFASTAAYVCTRWCNTSNMPPALHSHSRVLIGPSSSYRPAMQCWQLVRAHALSAEAHLAALVHLDASHESMPAQTVVPNWLHVSHAVTWSARPGRWVLWPCEWPVVARNNTPVTLFMPSGTYTHCLPALPILQKLNLICGTQSLQGGWYKGEPTCGSSLSTAHGC